MPDDISEGFEDFIRERRERADRTQQRLVSVLAVTCIMLAVSNVALALRLWTVRTPAPAEVTARGAAESSASPSPRDRVASRAEAPASATSPTSSAMTKTPSATTTPSASVAPLPAPRTTETPPPAPKTAADAPPSVTLPKTVDSAPPDAADPRGANVAAAEPPRTQVPPPVAAEPQPAPDLPQRPLIAAPARQIPTPRTMHAPPPPPPAAGVPSPAGPSMPEEATATWMLSTYGREAAEARARAALRFYDARSAEGRYWRGVLAMITASR